ncbi:carbohydrate esterase family 16 protein [Zopfia rhizophila CBS 207.26]|uniref:Carbohydrate esterase family 16 protein n=1 Tax=Zopfia rhizophila CBS 207.26 TaxID=1314779 RepID=A0A6A6DW91_9PEZI|nr:carbohydrate esterase family 16 protein [Zopfia rhizophila CBS 207.26]
MVDPSKSLLLCLFILLSRSAAQTSDNWPGLDGIENMFVFGDSYTATLFNISGPQPSPQNPFGNPPFPGSTSSNGRNWIDFLTYTHNASQFLTYNFAFPGAVVDNAVVPNRVVRSMKQQVQQQFLRAYTGQNKTWDSSNTLFASFFGINDVNLSYKNRSSTINPAIVSAYTGLVEQLYQAGARNFLFLNVPTIHRSPATVNQGFGSPTVNANVSRQFVDLQRNALNDFNTRLRNMASALKQQHDDATVFVFDNFELYDNILDRPDSLEQTAGVTNTTGFCSAYFRRTFDEDAFNSTCGIPQKEFFWLDPLHPTPPVHDAMAAEIAAQLTLNEVVNANGNTSASDAESFSVRSAERPLKHWMLWGVGYGLVFWWNLGLL